MKILTIVTILFTFSVVNLTSQIRINEVCASNSSSYYDEDSDTPDWIELYNFSDEPINLKNWRISDKDDYELAWQFPDTIIQPDQYLLVMASGKDRVSTGNISMNIHSDFSIVPFNNRDGFRFRYLKIGGNFEATVNIKSMRNEGVWSQVGLQARESLTDTTNFYAFFASSRMKDGFFNYKRENILDSPNWLALYGSLNLPFTKLWIKRENDTLFCSYIDMAGNKVNQEKYPNYLPDSVYFGISVSGFNEKKTAEFIVSDLTLNSKRLDILNMDVYEVNVLDKGYDFEYHEMHTDFSLSDGETLFLFNNNIKSDSLLILDNSADISQLLYKENWLITDNSTPGERNQDGYIERLPKPIIEFLDGRLSIIDTTGSIIKFTTDNSFPTANSKIFTSNNTLPISKTTTIIAQSFKNGYLNSFPTAKTYFVDEPESGFPIVVITTDSINLWGNEGIFNEKNFLISLKKNASFEYFSDDFSNNQSNIVNIKLHGNNSKYYPQKSIRIYANEYFGEKRIKNTFFKKSLVDKYDQLVLRNSGTDWGETFLKDAYNSVISNSLESQISAMYRPVLMYLNSNFYGLINFRERIDDDFISEIYNVEDSLINYFEDNGDYITGNYFKYYNYYNFIINFDPLGNKAFNSIDSLVDIENFCNYLIFETYASNHDWPWKNIKLFQSDSIDSRFRYILHDMDWTYNLFDFHAYDNKIYSLVADTTNHLPRIFQKFIQNERFKTEFLQKTCDAVNSVFKPEKMIRILDSLADQIRPVIPLHRSVWEESCVDWEDKLEGMRNYINGRPWYFMKNFDYYLNDENGRVEFTLSTFPKNSGTFKVNTITVDTSEWEGRYFQSIPVTITAIPKHGMKFIKWNYDSLGTESTITTTLPETYYLEAIYEVSDPTDEDTYIVINEIMYNADKDADTKDWIEIYNAGKKSVNLNGWSLLDEDDTHDKFIVEEDYTIQPDEYLILTREQTEFEKFISISNKRIGDFDFGLGGNDILRLYDQSGQLHDSVNYDNDAPWPIDADGTGYTIELINPSLDNNIATSWEKSQDPLGTSGKINSNYDTLKSNINISESDNQYEINVDDKIVNIKSNQFIDQINIYNVTGKSIERYNLSGTYNKSKSIDMSGLVRGVYLVVVTTNANVKCFKILIE